MLVLLPSGCVPLPLFTFQQGLWPLDAGRSVLLLTALPGGCLQMMQDWLNHYKLDRKALAAFAANAAAASNYEEWTLEQASRAVEDIVAKLVKDAGEGVGVRVQCLGFGPEISISLVQVSAQFGGCELVVCAAGLQLHVDRWSRLLKENML